MSGSVKAMPPKQDRGFQVVGHHLHPSLHGRVAHHGQGRNRLRPEHDRGLERLQVHGGPVDRIQDAARLGRIPFHLLGDIGLGHPGPHERFTLLPRGRAEETERTQEDQDEGQVEFGTEPALALPDKGHQPHQVGGQPDIEENQDEGDAPGTRPRGRSAAGWAAPIGWRPAGSQGKPVKRCMRTNSSTDPESRPAPGRPSTG